LILGLAGIFLAVATPAYANIPITWGMYAGGAQAAIGLSTVIGFILITFAEAWVFTKYLDLTWWEGIRSSLILNLASSAIGAFLGAIAFTEFEWAFLLGGPAAIFFLWYNRNHGMPDYYTGIILPCLIAGTLGLYGTLGVVQFNSPLIVYLVMLAPLILGFGLTLLYESLFAKSVLRVENPWKALLIANLCSYLILAVTIPFSPIKIHSTARYFIAQQLASNISTLSEEDTIDYLKRVHGSNLYLLGISKRSSPPRGYFPEKEIHGIKSAFYMSNYSEPDPDTALAVIDYVESYPDIDDETINLLERFKEQVELWRRLRDAIIAHDQSEVDKVYNEWETWLEDPPIILRDDFKIDMSLDPERAFYDLARKYESDLGNPAEREEGTE